MPCWEENGVVRAIAAVSLWLPGSSVMGPGLVGTAVDAFSCQ